MKVQEIAPYPLSLLFLLSTACAPAVSAEKAAPEGASMIAPIKNGEKYVNWLDTPMMVDNESMWSVTWKWIQGGERERPEGEIPVVPLGKDSFAKDASEGLTVRWLGHSSMLMELDGQRVLIDPVFERHASPVPGFTTRFSRSPVRVEDLPRIDAVVISHDHYDHLEKDTVAVLSKQGSVFLAPLGVGQDLRDWGVPAGQVRELTWWEESRVGPLTFACVPARHFSGRGLFDRNETLWAGWVIRGQGKTVYHSGDTGYAEHFAAIGGKYGPFDLTMIKIGAYGDAWPYIHLDPEQAVQAHADLRGRAFLPIHWATFPLALHPWDEPIVRAKKAAKERGATIITPMIGALLDMDTPGENRDWWKDVK